MAHSPASVSPSKPGMLGTLGEGGLQGRGPRPGLGWVGESLPLSEVPSPSPSPTPASHSLTQHPLLSCCPQHLWPQPSCRFSFLPALPHGQGPDLPDPSHANAHCPVPLRVTWLKGLRVPPPFGASPPSPTPALSFAVSERVRSSLNLFSSMLCSASMRMSETPFSGNHPAL